MKRGYASTPEFEGSGLEQEQKRTFGNYLWKGLITLVGLGGLVTAGDAIYDNGRFCLEDAKVKNEIVLDAGYGDNIRPALMKTGKNDVIKVGDYTIRAVRVNEPKEINGSMSDHVAWFDVYGPDGKIIDLSKSPLSTNKKVNLTQDSDVSVEELTDCGCQ